MLRNKGSQTTQISYNVGSVPFSNHKLREREREKAKEIRSVATKTCSHIESCMHIIIGVSYNNKQQHIGECLPYSMHGLSIRYISPTTHQSCGRLIAKYDQRVRKKLRGNR